MRAASLRMLCRYSLLLFLILLLVHMIRFLYPVSKQFHYSIKIFVTHFLAFYRLIDKISSFLLFLFPPFSHFLFSNLLLLFHLPLFFTQSLFHSVTTNMITHSLIFSRIFTLFKPLVCLSTCLFKKLGMAHCSTVCPILYYNGYYQSKIPWYK